MLVVLTIFLLSSSTRIVQADGPENLVTATFSISIQSGTQFLVNVTMNAEQLTIDQAFTENEIATASAEDLGALKFLLYQLLETQLQTMFPGAEFQDFSRPQYENNVFSESLTVQLPASFFSLPDNVDAGTMVNGLLDMDAIVYYTFTLQPVGGWNNAYIFVLPDSIMFRNTTGSVFENQISWQVNNKQDVGEEKTAWLSLQEVSPTTPMSATENISFSITIDSSSVETTNMISTIQAASLDLSSYALYPPSISNADILPSDGVRLLVQENLLSWQSLKNSTFDHIQSPVTNGFASAVNQSLTPTFDWNDETTTNITQPYDLNQMNALPSIKGVYTTENINLRLFDYTPKAIFGLAQAGAQANLSHEDVNIGSVFSQITYPFDAMFKLPEGITLNGSTLFSWNATEDFKGSMVATDAPDYEEQEIHAQVTIDMKRLDLNLLSFLSAKTEMTATMESTEDLDIHVTTLPSEFDIPDAVTLEYYNADALRVCIDEGVITQNQIDSFLERKKNEFNNHISNVVDVEETTGYVNNNIFSESLLWDSDITNMDDNIPVTVSSAAHCLYSVPFGISVLPPQMNITQQQFFLSGYDDRSVAYRMIFPKGISVIASDAQNKTITKGVTEDGREYIEVFFNAGEGDDIDTVSCMLSPSPLYVLGLFLPCILSFALVIILIVLVIFLRRKLRGRGRSVIRKQQPEEHSYEGEEFYVPPSPPSTR